MTILAIVVPCYNEEDILPETIEQLRALRQQLIEEQLISSESKIVFVDDGSRDRTWSIIYRACLRHEEIKGIKLAGNAGHQHALLAGMFAAKQMAHCIVTLDADLQDDIYVVREFLRKFHEGYDIVYGVRKKRDVDSYMKRWTAETFYRVMNRIGVKLIYNHADYRLMSRRAVEALAQFREVNMFLRGVVPLLGFPSTTVYYDRKERKAGVTKYPFMKMIRFAFDGLTSFSMMPIRFVSVLGFCSFFVSILFAMYVLFLKMTGHTQTGWTSLMMSIWLVGGLQLIAIGLVGEYIGKVYQETKQRPRYIVDMDLLNGPMIAARERETFSEEGIS
ncbi:putative glycosyltransferase ykoT [Anoxybacillus ayderensis]|uniref:Putative glycosyltransferase ykoT n=1 Tax=Anoxybacillus ayderensis TaxID=265546 RepID=A0A0D0G5H2_9BACL|nr:glycosyltransferase family 2 protein [Anoxybacillus ayderensis]EPZ39158.1 cell wall biosynthesis glycosyltransferase [Anoxybacillus ayderensis]KIP20635.1 putative glycosyltransferase ykoT [Anoxybacillus ayderensis]